MVRIHTVVALLVAGSWAADEAAMFLMQQHIQVDEQQTKVNVAIDESGGVDVRQGVAVARCSPPDCECLSKLPCSESPPLSVCIKMGRCPVASCIEPTCPPDNCTCPLCPVADCKPCSKFFTTGDDKCPEDTEPVQTGRNCSMAAKSLGLDFRGKANRKGLCFAKNEVVRLKTELPDGASLVCMNPNGFGLLQTGMAVSDKQNPQGSPTSGDDVPSSIVVPPPGVVMPPPEPTMPPCPSYPCPPCPSSPSDLDCLDLCDCEMECPEIDCPPPVACACEQCPPLPTCAPCPEDR